MPLLHDVVTRFNTGCPSTNQLAIAVTIIRGCKDSARDVRRRHSSKFPLAHAIGQDRYFTVQDRISQIELPDTTSHFEKHPRGSTSFTVLEAPGLRMIFAKLNVRHEIPQPTLFRKTEQARQLTFAFADRLTIEISFGLVEDSIDEVAFIDARFLDGEGGYLEEFVDMLALVPKTVPVEDIPDMRRTKIRVHKVRKPKDRV